MPAYARTGEVDNLDGFLIGLTPWAIQNLRFDESLGKSHGYDADLCLQAREAGRKVVTADLKVVHHHSLELIGDPERLDRGPHQGGREVGRPDADGPAEGSADPRAAGAPGRGARPG